MVDVLKIKILPSALTSYDLLKALALLLMFVDHIGYFFFPDEMWWRVVGRLSVPIWFFLIGFAQTREVPKLFWAAGVLVVVSALVAGEYLFPLSIVFTLILARMAVDWTMAHGLRNKEAFAGIFFLFLLLGPLSLMFVEYGTLGFLFMFIGALRRQKDIVIAPRWMILSFVAASCAAYILVQGVLFPSLSGLQLAVFAFGMAALSVVFYRFSSKLYGRFNVWSFAPVGVLQFMGRRTLEIYVVHLIVLRAVVIFTDPERFRVLDFKIFGFDFVQALLFGAV